jgi:small subunit ribosomal protein S5
MAEAQNTQAPAAAPNAGPQGGNDRGGNRSGQGRGGQGRGPRRDNRNQGPAEEKQFDERVLHIDRVARVVKGGRRFRFRALVVVGDAKKNKVGIGTAKGADVTAAVAKATEVAKKSLVHVQLKDGTLFHEAQAKVGGANILVKPASAGTGLIAGGVVRTILEVAGVSNALSKSLGSTNKTNTAYATIAALESVVASDQWVVTKTAGKKAAKAKAAEKVEA